jgi:hypothetical protein
MESLQIVFLPTSPLQTECAVVVLRERTPDIRRNKFPFCSLYGYAIIVSVAFNR